MKISLETMCNFFYRDIQQVRDMAEHDANEANQMRLFIHSLHNAMYQHRFEYVTIHIE
jgi:hypothetical protein